MEMDLMLKEKNGKSTIPLYQTSKGKYNFILPDYK
jgi:hypothetical protein